MAEKISETELSNFPYHKFMATLHNFRQEAYRLRYEIPENMTTLQLLTRDLWDRGNISHAEEFDIVLAQLNEDIGALKNIYTEVLDIPQHEPYDTLFPVTERSNG